MTGCLLITVLLDPARMANLTLQQWDVLVRQARRAGLLAKLYCFADTLGIVDQLAPIALRHLSAAQILVQAHTRAIRWEVYCILQALEELQCPVVILKGAAYVMAELPSAQGRMFNDTDILVPEERLAEVEGALRAYGWVHTNLDAYDQRYYRTWMHELPPLIHFKRESLLDVHHNILPKTARAHPDPKLLIKAAARLTHEQECYTLANEDMVLHSATHLFYDGEFDHGLRDLVDIDLLLKHFGTDQVFWDTLVSRSQQLQLSRPLYYALRYACKILHTTVPGSVMLQLQEYAPNPLLRWWMDQLFIPALMPMHRSCEGVFSPFIRWMLYVRGHYLRMPMSLLVIHLSRKAFNKAD